MKTRQLWAPAILLLSCLFDLMCPSRPAAAQEVIQEVAESLVHLRVEAVNSVGVPLEGQGTGFIVSEDGQVLTVNHLLLGLGPYVPETLKITGRVGQRGEPFDVKAAVINALPTLDLLLLKLSIGPNPYKPVKLGSTRSVDVLTNIGTSGFPLNQPGIWVDTGKVQSREGLGGSLWGTSMSFNAGQSGSPVYLENGAVIGVVKGQLSGSNINYFVPIDFADTLLIPLRLGELEKRISEIPRECRVCFSANGSAICSGDNRSCSEWSKPGAATGEEGQDGWSDALQIIQNGDPGFADCKLKWKLECR